MSRKPIDLAGQEIGYLVVERPLGSNGSKRVWELRCVCNTTLDMTTSDIAKLRKKGVKASCGCMKRQTLSERRTSHGMSHHPAFAVWSSMLARCHRKSHPAYKNYGARGIFVCDRWLHSFENFWMDMGHTYAEGLTLDRLDNDKGYSPSNCAWVTWAAQARNRRTSVGKVPTPKGEMYIEEVSEVFGIPKSTVRYRVNAGLSGDELVAPPKNGNHLTGSLRA